MRAAPENEEAAPEDCAAEQKTGQRPKEEDGTEDKATVRRRGGVSLSVSASARQWCKKTGRRSLFISFSKIFPSRAKGEVNTPPFDLPNL